MDVIKETLQALPKKNKLLLQFSKSYLTSMPPRMLNSQNPTALASFLEERFDFFKSACGSETHFKIYTAESSDTWSFRKQRFEFVCYDAGFLIMTFQSMFREFGLKITKLLHPVINAEVDGQGEIKGIDTGTKTSKNFSVTYIEFDDVEDKKTLDVLTSRIEKHLCAVQMSFQDSDSILKKLDHCFKGLKKAPHKSPEPIQEWENLLNWLNKDNFSFFGYVKFEITNDSSEDIVASDGLGILSNVYTSTFDKPLINVLQAHVWKVKDFSTSFVFDTLKSKSPIQRFENLMRLSLKIKTKDGRIEDHNFVGLLRRSSLLTRNMDTPLIHLKMKHIFEQRNIRHGSFDEHEVIRIFNAIPKFELFRTPVSRLLHMVDDLFSITNPNEIYCFSQPRTEKKRLPLIIFIPPYLFTSTNIEKIKAYLVEQIPHTDFETIVIRGEESCRLHIYFEQVGNEDYEPDVVKLASDMRDIVKPWEERLKDVISEEFPGVLGKQLYIQYGPYFPTHYKVRRTPKEAVRDIGYLEKVVHEETIQFSLVPFYFTGSILSGAVSLLTIYNKEKIDLIRIMPILQLLGLHVYDEVTTRIGTADSQFGYIHSFRVTDKDGQRIDDTALATQVVTLLKEVFSGHTENDPLNGLVLKTPLDWRLINVLMTYRNLFLQLELPYSKDRINKVLLMFPHAAELLASFFETKFSTSPDFGKREYRQRVLLPKIKQDFTEMLVGIKDVADDAILKGLFELMEYTVRTNFYIPKTDDQTYISIKLLSQQISIMPNPRPKFEIYVHDVNMEGTHLRFGSVARGGLRWSERPDDFRREVLGLVKTQQVKNAVIVPVGAKGGFVVKGLAQVLNKGAEVERQYTKFIASMLDITDNYDAKGQIKRPNYVIAYDNPDPYMVVAADKGTAALSDTANGIAKDFRFWLGDGFASGGSDGYNHKTEGITARGAWECVVLHFKGLGIDVDKDTFTAVGVGDMSGDVFGNGMLLSKNIKLNAAFNHMHIFLDPDPDPAKSWKERKRLFDMPGSKWTDYNQKLISKGGGVFDRKAKSIELTPELQKMLGVKVDALSGEAVIKAVLKMKTDLLWFGGIGTYIKSPEETDLEVGDPANDNIRIFTHECKARVVGEGANLGITQLGRIKLDDQGVCIDTDAIDNSAGVNMSDMEVNIKILFQKFLEQSVLKDDAARNKLLQKITDEVSELCLENNRAQHRLISLDAMRSEKHFRLFIKYVDYLIKGKVIDRAQDCIPNRSVMNEYAGLGKPMPRPVLAVLQAYTKMKVYNAIMQTDLVNDSLVEHLFVNYFPVDIQKLLKKHPTIQHNLKSEIIGTVLTNKVINQAGVTFAYWAMHLTGKDTTDVFKAYFLFDDALEGQAFRTSIYDLNIKERSKHLAILEFEYLLQKLVVDLLMTTSFEFNQKNRDLIRKLYPLLRKKIESTVTPSEAKKWKALEFPEKIINKLASFKKLEVVVDIAYLNQNHKFKPEESYGLLERLENIFSFEWLKEKIKHLDLETNAEFEQREILIQTVRFQKLNFINILLKSHAKKDVLGMTESQMKDCFMASYKGLLTHYFSSIKHLKAGSPINLTSLSVAVDRLNFIHY